NARLTWPLMENNITRRDLDAVIAFLRQDEPILTQSRQVRAFEQAWSEWVGVRHSVFVNSGSSANLVTMAALRELYGPGEVIVPTITWVSDIAAVLHCGLTPVLVDIDPRTLGMDTEQVIGKLSPRTRAVFITHVLGYNAVTQRLLDELERRGIPLIEDVCEAHGATFQGRRLGSLGLASNFSFYYAHHLSTIEGGMVCTNDVDFYETVRLLRSHGLVRELHSQSRQREYRDEYPDLNPEFIFALPAYNVRSTEINAVIGLSQLPRLEETIARRNENLQLFLECLDPAHFQTDFALDGCSNYAFTLILRRADDELMRRVTALLRQRGVEYRRGTSGGGNQARQPYLRRLLGADLWRQFPRADHVHFYGLYLGNYPTLERAKIRRLCEELNDLPRRS
ncbi:MAG: DegT/DnrJ/EryC1/StrS aminotransferase family protein, partial [Gemmataceae bacterium]|nr:DegT/DnrJ/EryC1/StrS aminotransferase family protein [Gemmataceae bacterium]